MKALQGILNSSSQKSCKPEELQAKAWELDATAIHTLLNGGTVYAVEPEKVPDNAPLAAVFRYVIEQ